MTKKETRPLSPDEVGKKKIEAIPSEVFEVVNTLLGLSGSTDHITFRQCEVIDRLVARGFTSGQIFQNHWLDFEDAYRAAGWIVEYDKPGFNETYEPIFTFKRRRSTR